MEENAKPVIDITLEEYFMGRDKLYPGELTDMHKANAVKTVEAANAILEAFGQRRRVASGWRPSAINAATRGAAPHSKHVLCQAVDIEDNNTELMQWCLNNKDILAKVGVWLEDPRDTPTWVHFQIVPPGSGLRFFRAF